MSKFEIYQDKTGEYRWRMRYDGYVTVDSGEGYPSKEGARGAAGRVKRKDSGTEEV